MLQHTNLRHHRSFYMRQVSPAYFWTNCPHKLYIPDLVFSDIKFGGAKEEGVPRAALIYDDDDDDGDMEEATPLKKKTNKKINSKYFYMTNYLYVED